MTEPAIQDDLPAYVGRAATPGPLTRRLLPSPLDLLMIVAYVASLTRPVFTDNLWWRLKTGSWMIRSFDVPHTNLYAFTARDHSWIEPGWLGDVTLFLVFDKLGPAWLLLLRGVLFALTIGLLYRLLRHRGGVVPSLLLGAGAIAALLPGLSIEPQLFTSLFLVMALTLLEDRDWRHGRAMVALPMLFCIWANVHSTSVIGLGLVLGHCTGALLDARRLKGDSSTFSHLIAFVLALLFSLCNPYYGSLLSLGLEDVWQVIASAPLRLQLVSWPYLALASLLSVGTGLVVAAAGREVRWRLALPLVVLSPVALLAPTYIPLWVVWAAVTIMEHFQQIAERVRHERRGYLEQVGSLSRTLRRVADRFALYSTYDRFISRGNYAAMTLALALTWFSMPPGATRTVAGITLRGLTLEELIPEDQAPLNAVDSLLAVAFPGAQIMAPTTWAGYLIWAGHPEVQVFIDGREGAYPLDIEDDYDRFADARPGWEDVLERYQVDYLLWPHDDFQPRALADTGHWVQLYTDQTATVLARQRDPDEPRVTPELASPGPQLSRTRPGMHLETAGQSTPPVESFGLFRTNRSGPGRE